MLDRIRVPEFHNSPPNNDSDFIDAANFEQVPRDSCGVVGITSKESCSMFIYFALRALQHRGQESAGIVTYEDVIHYKRDMGLVHEIFNERLVEALRGECGIGHVRYSTQGSSTRNNAQPVVATSSVGEISLSHNGEIVNADALRQK